MAAPLSVVLLLPWLMPGASASAGPLAADALTANAATLYREIGLHGVLDSTVFTAGYASMAGRGLTTGMLAIADMSQPSTARRLYVIDLETKKLVLRTWVAHGQGSGGLIARGFSNRHGSLQTSLGLYRVGQAIVSPKHGPALLLYGLDRGVNDRAQAREVIIHGADYVSAAYIAKHRRLGRSWGCPAVPRADIARVIDLLAEDGLLFVYGRSATPRSAVRRGVPSS
jgi:hypothetical protein